MHRCTDLQSGEGPVKQDECHHGFTCPRVLGAVFRLGCQAGPTADHFSLPVHLHTVPGPFLKPGGRKERVVSSYYKTHTQTYFQLLKNNYNWSCFFSRQLMCSPSPARMSAMPAGRHTGLASFCSPHLHIQTQSRLRHVTQ